MNEALVGEPFPHDNAHHASILVLHERLGGALELVIDPLALPIGEHSIGSVLHLQHVVIERGVLRGHIHRHLAQAPLHAAIGHPVERLAALRSQTVDELRIGGVVVLIHSPIGQRLRVEGVAREGELLLVLARIATQNAAHAGLLGVASRKAERLHADDRRAQLGSPGSRIQTAAARAHHADVAFVIPHVGNGSRRNGSRVVGRKGRRVVLPVGAVHRTRIGEAAFRYRRRRVAGGRPVADAPIGGQGRLRPEHRCRSSRRGSQSSPSQEIAPRQARRR